MCSVKSVISEPIALDMCGWYPELLDKSNHLVHIKQPFPPPVLLSSCSNLLLLWKNILDSNYHYYMIFSSYQHGNWVDIHIMFQPLQSPTSLLKSFYTQFKFTFVLFIRFLLTDSLSTAFLLRELGVQLLLINL